MLRSSFDDPIYNLRAFIAKASPLLWLKPISNVLMCHVVYIVYLLWMLKLNISIDSRRVDVRGADGSVAGGWAGGRQSGFHSPPGLGPGTLWHCAMCPPIVWKNIQGESKKSVLSNQLEKPTGPYLTLSDLTGPYWALLGLTGPYWALLAYLLNLYTH